MKLVTSPGADLGGGGGTCTPPEGSETETLRICVATRSYISAKHEGATRAHPIVFYFILFFIFYSMKLLLDNTTRIHK